MNDTCPAVATKLRDLFMQRSGAERMNMGFEMFSLSRMIVTSSMEAQGYRGDELRKQIFLRTYGQDFSSETVDKICQGLQQYLNVKRLSKKCR